jgi:carbamoyl-phosphate synthase large subunit
LTGKVFVSVRDEDKAGFIAICRDLVEIGFEILATGGTTDALTAAGVPATRINKVMEGRPHVVDAMLSGDIQIVFNTAMGAASMQGFFLLASHGINEQNSILYDGIRQPRCRSGHSGHAAG